MMKLRMLSNKGQNVIEYLLIIAVLALGIIVGGKYLRNIVTQRTKAEKYETSMKLGSGTGGYYQVNDRKNAITTFGTSVPITTTDGTKWK